MRAIRSKRIADRLEPLLSATLPDPREDHIMERVDQAVGPLLMLEPVQRERFPGMPVSTHQPFDKHLRKVVEHARILQPDQGRRKCIALRRSHFLHARRIETLRFKSELPQLCFGKNSVQGDRRPLAS
jgi:hypothetical protein